MNPMVIDGHSLSLIVIQLQKHATDTATDNE